MYTSTYMEGITKPKPILVWRYAKDMATGCTKAFHAKAAQIELRLGKKYHLRHVNVILQ